LRTIELFEKRQTYIQHCRILFACSHDFYEDYCRAFVKSVATSGYGGGPSQQALRSSNNEIYGEIT
jgi:hypothetical protein